MTQPYISQSNETITDVCVRGRRWRTSKRRAPASTRSEYGLYKTVQDIHIRQSYKTVI